MNEPSGVSSGDAARRRSERRVWSGHCLLLSSATAWYLVSNLITHFERRERKNSGSGCQVLQRSSLPGPLSVTGWNLSPIEQNWDHRNAALWRRTDFNAHKVARIIDTTIALFVGDVEPSGSDHCEQNIATRDLSPQPLDEVDSSGMPSTSMKTLRCRAPASSGRRGAPFLQRYPSDDSSEIFSASATSRRRF